jgi:hypothetical protein
VDTVGRESRKDRVNPARKYIRLQIVGMAFGLAIPVMAILAGMYGFDRFVPQIAVLMLVIAVVIFGIGDIGRQELKERKKE